MSTPKKLIIVGNTAFAEIAYEYFTYDSDYEVVAFSVNEAYIDGPTLFGLPVVPFETLEAHYAPAEHSVYVASVYTHMNRLRTRLLTEAKAKGYAPASYISSKAFVWRNVELGEHVFIFENNVVQPFVKIGNNVVLWSGNHIGHHSTIRDNCFVSSHVVVSGFVDVGENCFLGVNATIANNLTIGRDTWLSPNITVLKTVEPGTMFKLAKPEVAPKTSLEFFKIDDAALQPV